MENDHIRKLVLGGDLPSLLRENQCTSLVLKFDDIDVDFEATAMVHGFLCFNQDMQAIADALRENSSLTEVCLDGNWGGRFFEVPNQRRGGGRGGRANGNNNNTNSNTDDDASRCLLQSICNLPNLKELILESGRGTARDLTQLLGEAKRLEILEFYDVVLEGDERDFIALNETLAMHQSLTKVITFFLRFPTEITQTSLIVDQMLQSLLKIPTLTTLGIWASLPKGQEPNSSSVIFATETLLQACSSPTLQVLELSGVLTPMNAEEQAIPRMAQTLGHNAVLQCLHLHCDLDEANTKALAQLIRNNQFLDIIRIDLNNVGGGDTTTTCNNHSNIAQNNNSSSNNNLHPQNHLSQLALALRSNSALTKFKLVAESTEVLANNSSRNNNNNNARRGRFDTDIAHAFVDLVQHHNYSLREVHLFDPALSSASHLGWNDMVKFYLRLNAQGRREMLQLAQENPKAYVDKLHQLARKNDLDALYYYVQMNPNLLV